MIRRRFAAALILALALSGAYTALSTVLLVHTSVIEDEDTLRGDYWNGKKRHKKYKRR